ncbi:MAG: tRNA (adenosine(37)-N6)-threonylcarbamoyltransferase complex transferase subunit TsaD [Rhodothermales bacterium]|nr:tRNA (adenosine(37)-N6)-threonylcarbamoyltransferase complex transferase subunit TsaD [Rhodothermales bacterium]MBO6780374.1 tRNA (adenosine(37)-N6)-threonylcarbamoyltransferase complex transferase subunit TsaD [Rhodothermales bacterium]
MAVILGIETSCDDTAAAVVRDGQLASSIVSSQPVHRRYGGVVPELASRDHQRLIVPVVREALETGDATYADLDGIAVTHGPGLAGSLLVGLSFAKGLAWALDQPLIGVNHLEGHLFSLFLGPDAPQTPFLCLIVSGGHTQVVRVDDDFSYTTLGRTRDDAAGEAFDKVGKLLGLPYPGGPEVDRRAALGNPEFVRFPRTHLKGVDFSFSGIKTAVLYYLNGFDEEARRAHLAQHLNDLCASFQAAVVEMLVRGVARAIKQTGIRRIALAGGVSANSGLRAQLDRLAERERLSVHVPELRYCMDNAAMIAMAGHAKLSAGRTDPLSLTAEPALRL